MRTAQSSAQRELQAAIEARNTDEEFSQSWGYHSRVSVTHRYVCMTIPKVGCTTIKRTLRAWEDLPALDDWGALHENEEHPRLAHFSSAATAQMLTSERWTRFAFVRNPYDRLFSAWKSKIANTWDTQYLWLRDAIRDANGYPPSTDRFTPYVAFADYARFVATTDEARVVLDGHLNLQSNVLLADLIPYDVVGRFETFADDFAAVLRRLSAPDHVVALAADVTNATPRLPLAAAYDRDLADTVYRKYEPDFEAFRYRRDSWLYT